MEARTPSITGRPPLLFEDFTCSYPGSDSAALDGVSLAVESGEFVVVAGRSGSGKSSLLKAACGLIPHFHGGAVSGQVSVGGRDTAIHGPGELADLVGYLAQDPETQVISTTVAAEIELPLRFRGDGEAARARAVEEVALALAISHLLDRTVNSLSGGELQRVALAAALVTRPGLILLDEPTSQLDPVAGDELIWLLRRLNEEWGVSVVMAEHRLERCLGAADRVVAMEAGSIAFDGRPEAFLEFALSVEPALATPAARMFAEAGLPSLPVGVRQARTFLGEWLSEDGMASERPDGHSSDPGSTRSGNGRALRCKELWVELSSAKRTVDVLKGVDLTIEPGEKVALMGRNGAGKSTLLRAAAGIVPAVAGSVTARGGVALLTQSPGDYLVRETVGEELGGPEGRAALDAVGLDLDPSADPRDLSGGERQRLALAIAIAGRTEGDALPDLVALDEPTRGMDRMLKEGLIDLVDLIAGRGAAVVIATHDVEFAAAFADRVLLLGDGELVADSGVGQVLAGGWYFATEVSRVLDLPGVVTVEDGVEAIGRMAGHEGTG